MKTQFVASILRGPGDHMSFSQGRFLGDLAFSIG